MSVLKPSALVVTRQRAIGRPYLEHGRWRMSEQGGGDPSTANHEHEDCNALLRTPLRPRPVSLTSSLPPPRAAAPAMPMITASPNFNLSRGVHLSKVDELEDALSASVRSLLLCHDPLNASLRVCQRPAEPARSRGDGCGSASVGAELVRQRRIERQRRLERLRRCRREPRDPLGGGQRFLGEGGATATSVSSPADAVRRRRRERQCRDQVRREVSSPPAPEMLGRR